MGRRKGTCAKVECIFEKEPIMFYKIETNKLIIFIEAICAVYVKSNVKKIYLDIGLVGIKAVG